MMLAIIEKARRNRILALRTVAARNAEPPQTDPTLPAGAATSRGPKLELVDNNSHFGWATDNGCAA